MGDMFTNPEKPEITIADSVMTEALKAATTWTVLKDSDGNVIGHFLPTLEAELAAMGLTIEEMNRRANAPRSEYVSAEAVTKCLQSLRKELQCTK